MSAAGYYLYPTIHREAVVFVSEHDLWMAPLSGGVPRRLTTGLGSASFPSFSPDGEYIAFSATEEGHTEAYVMPAKGGPSKRLTYMGDAAQIVGWKEDRIIFASSYNQPFGNRFDRLFTVHREGGEVELLPTGPANYISYGPKNQAVIQRHGYREFGFWKRYRGGTAGELWVDNVGKGQFQKFLNLKGNFSRPLWIGERIYFAADHEGVGNVYSCFPDGSDIRRHTHHEEFYTRNIGTDGHTIVYHAGGDLYSLDIASNHASKLDIQYMSPRVGRNRKFVSARKYLEDADLHPHGHSLTLVSRGKAFSFNNWGGPVLRYGVSEKARYRLPRWLNDGKRLLIVSDAGGEETLEIYDATSMEKLSQLSKPSIGRVLDIKVSPKTNEAVLTNHRSELIFVSLKTWRTTVLDRSEYAAIAGFDWSSDGQWIAYNCSVNRHTSHIKIINPPKGKPIAVTRPVLRDVCPAFDPDGKYLYFISYRQFDPVPDALHFEYGFPRGMRPYLITLQKDTLSPFQRPAKALDAKADDDEKGDSEAPKKPKPVHIDFEGIEDRALAFPVDDGIYGQIAGVRGKALFTGYPIEGSLGFDWTTTEEPDASALLEAYDFENNKMEVIAEHITEFQLSLDAKTLLYRSGNDLRVIKAGEKAEENASFDHYSKRNGWIDSSRIKVMIDPVNEWRQMFYESWRLQRDHFWREDMATIDWHRVLERYESLIERVGTRMEFSDLLWEMQGELGTSHAYVFGGDVRPHPCYALGSLGADFEYDQASGVYRIVNIIRGDPWDEKASSPLIRPGMDIEEGDLLWEIGGKALNAEQRPEPLLVNMARQEVRITVSKGRRKAKRHLSVKTLASSTPAMYRQWVEDNREYVHEKSKGKLGYLHIPDMGPQGFSEFHRGFLAECDYEGLIVDVRFNGGGSVSPLLIEKLARRRLGFDLTRWFGVYTYPEDSPSGPMVALINEYAGSDGDIFSHAFKMLKLGPLIGKRTWGGVVGVWPRHTLVDGGFTTQPEFSFWFSDIGWTVENYGVQPDIEVEIAPHDYVAGRDPQLDRGIEEALRIIELNPGHKGPDLTSRPVLRAPTLPRQDYSSYGGVEDDSDQ